MKVKKSAAVRGLGALVLFAGGVALLASCPAKGFDAGKAINVVSREDGSGTRGVFIELFGIEVKGAGTRKDLTTKESLIAKQTDVMLTNIAADKYAAGYVSLGSLSDAVKAVDIDGVRPSADNVKNGSYKVAQPFIIAIRKSGVSGLAADFIAYILSREGQSVIAAAHYIAVDEAGRVFSGAATPAEADGNVGGKIVVAGSSSVTPVMEKLREAYLKLNPGAAIEIQMSDSTTGMTAAVSGICDIGMSSRALKENEENALIAIQIALDGLVLIVNKENPVSNLTKEQVNGIFTGKIVKWSEVVPPRSEAVQ
jgi:phosphate transport system substrate-binding protein